MSLLRSKYLNFFYYDYDNVWYQCGSNGPSIDTHHITAVKSQTIPLRLVGYRLVQFSAGPPQHTVGMGPAHTATTSTICDKRLHLLQLNLKRTLT